MSGQKRDPRYDERLPAVGRRLAAIREQLDLSQQAMAAFLGFSRRQWVSWENGQVSPSIWVLFEIMDKLQIDPAWIIDGPGVAPILRGKDGGKARLARLQAEVGEMAKGFGLVIPEGFEHQLAVNIFSQPVDLENVAKRQVQNILRELAMGKDD